VQTSSKAAIKIGWPASLTGPLSSAAVWENRGVVTAVKQINAKGGIDGHKIDLITDDTEGDPTTAVSDVQSLIDVSHVNFIIGPVNSGEALATVPIVAKAGIPNIVTGTIDSLTNPTKYPLAYRTISTNKQ
jgi:branched-chain amino acid transport system substrate-binding protein